MNYADGSIQDRDRPTALRHPKTRLARALGVMAGRNSRSRAQRSVTSRRVFQNPIASPAKYAAPSAVVSLTFGRVTVLPRTSA